MAETPPKKDSGGSNPLEEFLNAAESFVANVSAAMLKAAGDHENSVLIDGTSKVIVAQFASITQEVRASYRTANLAAREETDHFLSIQQGTLLARTGEETATVALRTSARKGFFSWVSQHLEEIKKLIKFIVKLIFRRVPGWLEDLLLLIDELWNLIVSLLSEVFGISMRETAADISARTVNTMNELAALERLEQARKGGEPKDEE
jgi:hypothetical protein